MSEAPNRPTLLVIEPDDDRRRALAVALAERGYEAIPTRDADEGLRFARALGPAVIVVPADLALAGEGALFAALREGEEARTLLLLGATPEEGEELPEEVLYLATAGLATAELLGRVRLVLVGHELGVAPDLECGALVGSFERMPPLELVQACSRLDGPCRVELADGAFAMSRGKVVHAEIGGARGEKAFCRLVRRHAGPFRIHLEPVALGPGDPAAIDRELPALVIAALEDLVPAAPEDRLRLLRGSCAPGPSDDLVREILSLVDVAAAEGEVLSVGGLLDRLPFHLDGEIYRALLRLRERRCLELSEPGGRVRVVTDSTADLPEELARRYAIEVVPLRVGFGTEEYRDGIEITPRSFYELLATKRDVHPVTSPPPVEELLGIYRKLAVNADVVSVHISSRLSQTFAAVEEALLQGAGELAAPRRDGSRPRLVPFDSRSVSAGLGLQALFAARLAAAGLGAAEIGERLAALGERLHVLFVVDTLDYLVRGGRIGRARALVGSLLGIRPILGVVDGEVTAVDRVRGRRRGQPRMLELFAERLDRQRPVFGAIAHANAPVGAERLRTLLARTFDMRELILMEIGPVVGTHAGPGMVGAALFQPADDAELALLLPR